LRIIKVDCDKIISTFTLNAKVYELQTTMSKKGHHFSRSACVSIFKFLLE